MNKVTAVAAAVAFSASAFAEQYDALPPQISGETPTYAWVLQQTTETVSRSSYTCNVGRALPSEKGGNWYTNDPIAGATFELRARGGGFEESESKYTLGYAVLLKDGNVVTALKNEDEEDWYEWGYSGVIVKSAGIPAYQVSFDRITGDGFVYTGADTAVYFLSKCHAIPREVPVYSIDTTSKF